MQSRVLQVGGFWCACLSAFVRRGEERRRIEKSMESFFLALRKWCFPGSWKRAFFFFFQMWLKGEEALLSNFMLIERGKKERRKLHSGGDPSCTTYYIRITMQRRLWRRFFFGGGFTTHTPISRMKKKEFEMGEVQLSTFLVEVMELKRSALPHSPLLFIPANFCHFSPTFCYHLLLSLSLSLRCQKKTLFVLIWLGMRGRKKGRKSLEASFFLCYYYYSRIRLNGKKKIMIWSKHTCIACGIPGQVMLQL